MTMLLSAWQMPMFTSKSIISYINNAWVSLFYLTQKL